MTTRDQQPATYPWRAAPSHLKTRRQLRDAGLSPGGQDVAALMIRQRRGRRLTAFLFDIAKARPKRTPSPAQLAAIEKATRTHQLRAAERRGYTADDLHTPTDLGPTWSETPTLQEETIVNTNESTAERVRPQGLGQRRAWLHALVATNQARDRRNRLDTDLDQAARAGGDVEAEYLAGLRRDLDAAETRLSAVRGIGDPYTDTTLLADALYWSPGSDTAARLAEQITSGLAAEWGVRIDPESWQVSVDPGFDAAAAQTAAETSAVRARETAIIDVVSGLALPDHTAAAVNQAVQAWAEATPASSSDLGERREQLRGELAGVRCADTDRALIEFTVDYLTDHTAGVDLLDTPVLVDPGQEVRGRIPQLLEQFTERRIAPAQIAEEISVMTDADQQAVREVGAATMHELEQIGFQVWPGWVDRDQVFEQLHEYATEAREHHSDINYLATQDLTDDERDNLGVSDDIGARIDRMTTARTELLDTAATAKGLTAAERHHLTAVIGDIDTGTISSETELPELMWVDERTKAAVDDKRSYATGYRVCSAVTGEVTRLLSDAGVDLSHRDHGKLASSVSAIGSTLDSVAYGGSLLGLDSDREAFLTRRTRLGQHLRDTGIRPDTMTAIREVVDGHARDAGQAGQAAIERRGRWKDRITAIAAARDDALAQRRAATAGCSTGPVRACTTSPAVTTQATGPIHSPHIRRLHGEEIGR
ncbi:hypothetical protein IU449_27575 [Nocardia higoensis]|uniref:Uncharacterized protein n=1 Tax=Nocardia higoensis TaxID=228599 RepID=A0ABS0DL37_9NOCA|nr:RRQRL motif-containing zinc-binding protein [Nocardia higoensis]MBF6358262.1 hypothetical protein [Nocardia higoensis]